ncbi:MAG: DMT family transporter [Caulobacter sp.]
MQKSSAGWSSGLIGVVIFSGTLPSTRLAIADLSPWFLVGGRAVVAALIGAPLLVLLRASRPARADLGPLAIVSLGVVVGFPLLSSLALRFIPASHAIVFVGLLPICTAIFGVVRGGERPQPTFWVFSLIGAAVVGGFAFQPGQVGSGLGNLSMVGAIVLCGLGYAEGAALSRRIGGWQVISWALLLCLPVMAVLAATTAPADWTYVRLSSWLALGYLGVFSMMLGFVFWYRGLALGGATGVGQLQLLQPFMGLGLSALVLGEHVTLYMLVATGLVIACVAGARRYAGAPPAQAVAPSGPESTAR